MLNSNELLVLESLLVRARAAADPVASIEGVLVGDVVQLRPGADPHWETSLFLVCAITHDGGIRGQILRPHRSGAREAWYTYRPPEVLRIGCAPFPEPPAAIRSWGRPEPCAACHDLRRAKAKKFT